MQQRISNNEKYTYIHGKLHLRISVLLLHVRAYVPLHLSNSILDKFHHTYTPNIKYHFSNKERYTVQCYNDILL